MFLSQVVLGGNRFVSLSDEEITSTIAQVFLHGVVGTKESTA
jgi:hypothetical protein